MTQPPSPTPVLTSHRPSLAVTLIRALLAGFILVFGLMTLFSSLYWRSLLQEQTSQRLDYIAKTQARNASRLLWDFDLDKLQTLLKNITDAPNVTGARIMGKNEGGTKELAAAGWPPEPDPHTILSEEIVYENGETIRDLGTLQIIVDYSSVEDQLRQSILLSATIFSLSFLAIAGLAYYILKRGLTPVTHLSRSLLGVDYFRHTIEKPASAAREINDLFDSLITMQRLMQDQTLEIESQKKILDTIIQNMPLGMLVENLADAGRLVIVNKKFRKLMELPAAPDPAEPATLPGLIDDKLAAFMASLNDRVCASREALTETYTLPRAAGSQTLQIIKAPILVEGRVGLIVTMVEDITEQVRVYERLKVAKDEAEAASRSKSDFLANMSHEIRTPMNAVLGMSGLLLDSPLPPEQKEWAEAVNISGQTLLNIINDIIDISKIESGKLLLEQIDFDLFDMMQEVVNLYSFQAREKRIEMLMEIDPALPRYFRGDTVRLKQIFANLLGNALKFTSSGHILIRAMQKPSVEGLARLEFQFEDTGIGIPLAKQQKIFEKFSQAEESTTRRFGGAGLGLAIVSELVELMGGTLSVESEPGKGSTFTFDLYLENSDKNAEQNVHEDLSWVRALVVDDYPLTCRMLEETLTRNRITCQSARSAQEALTLLETAGGFNMCIVDYAMDGMNGLAFVQAVRANPDYKDLTLIMVSGVLEKKSYEELEEIGLAGFIKKPFRQDQILNAFKIISRYKRTGKPLPFITRHNATPATAEHVTPEKPVKSYPGKKAMAVEDMKMNMMLIKKVLGKFGLEVEEAVNGLEAVEKIKTHTFDVIFMDCQMPEMDGFEATRTIRKYEREKGQEPVPIIALTADAMVGDREKCLSVGMDDYINKPFREDDIVRALSRWIDRL
jgi:signal transduction histidine kinase/CheY-like chemotaxis protein